MSLRRGMLSIEGVKSPFSLVDPTRAVYGETQSLWSPRDAEGFSRIYGVQGALAHEAMRRAGGES